MGAARRGRAAIPAAARGDGAGRPRRRHRLRERVHRLRRRRPLPVRLCDRAPLRLRPPPARGRAVDRLPERGPLRRRARDDVDRRAGVRRPARRMARRPREGHAGRGLRARLHAAGAGLPGARGRHRPRAVGGRVRPCAGDQERLRARLGPRQRPHQHRGVLGLPGGVRPGPQRAGDAGTL